MDGARTPESLDVASGVRENRANSGRKDLHCPKPLVSFVAENGCGSVSFKYGVNRLVIGVRDVRPEIAWAVISLPLDVLDDCTCLEHCLAENTTPNTSNPKGRSAACAQ